MHLNESDTRTDFLIHNHIANFHAKLRNILLFAMGIEIYYCLVQI